MPAAVPLLLILAPGVADPEVPMAAPNALRVIEADLSQPVLRTAAASLQAFLQAQTGGAPLPLVPPSPAPGSGAVVVGTAADSPALAAGVRTGELRVHDLSATVDAFEVASVDGAVLVNGANPRAALYGVYELQDAIARHGGVPSDLHEHGVPELALRLLHPRVRGGFHGYRRTDFEHIARCGGNVAHLSHDWMAEKTLFSFAPCEEFPRATEPAALEANRRHLRQYLAWCEEFGLGAALWLCEVVCQGGPWVPEAQREAFLGRFPAECLSDTGTYQGKVLCPAHPLVQQAYRGMVRRLLTDFPQLSMVLVFSVDSNGELCDPGTCPRHRGVSKLQQYDALLALLAGEGREVRPDFRVFSVGWGWHFRGDPAFLPGQAELPAGAGLTSPPDGEAWSFDRKLTDMLVEYRRLTRDHGQTFLGYDIFLWGDDTVFPETELYDFPLGVAAKLRRWRELGADGVFDQWGTQAEYVQCNAVALRRGFLHPETTEPSAARAFAEQLACGRFGKAAAAHVLAAWEQIEAAQQIQSDHTYYWHHLRPAWAGPTLSTPLTYEALSTVALGGGEPPKPSGSIDYAPYRDDLSRAQVLGPALQRAADHFAAAVEELQRALQALPPGQLSTYDHWHTPEPGAPAGLSPRELLDRQLVAAKLQESTQRRLGLFFEAYALAKTMPEPGRPGHEEGLDRLRRLQEAYDGSR